MSDSKKTDWALYFRTRQQELEAAHAVAIADEPITRTPAIPQEKVGISVKRVLTRADAIGLEVKQQAFFEHRGRTFYMTDSDNHTAGDVKTEAKDIAILQVFARHPQARLGVLAEFADNKFSWARVADPVGVPRELYVDYMPNKVEAKSAGWSEGKRVAVGGRLNGTYNDGAMLNEHDVLFTKATDLIAWLDDWQAILSAKKAA